MIEIFKIKALIPRWAERAVDRGDFSGLPADAAREIFDAAVDVALANDWSLAKAVCKEFISCGATAEILHAIKGA